MFNHPAIRFTVTGKETTNSARQREESSEKRKKKEAFWHYELMINIVLFLITVQT
jgi:hypothetical protein